MSKNSGKIEQDIAEIIFQNCGYARSEVGVGPAFGVDVSIIDLPNGLAIAATSDPLSLIPSLGLEESAWLSVHLMVNDMATTGFAPMYGQFVLNLPATLSKDDLKTYWKYIDKFCRETGIAVTGGHTGFIEGQNSTISGGGTLFTVAPKDQMLVSKNARVTDSILVTKQCAISSTAILAKSFPETIINKLGREVAEEGAKLFYQTSSLQDALIAAGTAQKHPEVTAMHDVTEGGVLGAVYELVSASGNGAVIYDENLPLGQVQQEIGNLFSIDQRYTIGAGAMIIICEKGKEQQVIDRLKKENIACSHIGEVTAKEKGVKLNRQGREEDLKYFSVDPYWKAFFDALKKGWK